MRLTERRPSGPVLLSALLLLAAAAGGARADTEASDAIGFGGRLGLTGFQDLVDARVPETLAIRAGVHYVLNVVDQDFRGAINASRKQRRHDFDLYAGASALGLLDAAIKLPYVYDRDEVNRNGILSDFKDRDVGWGDVDVAAKVTIGLGPIVLAPYLAGRFPSGEPAVRDLAQFEYGAAATLGLLNEHVGLHANLAGLQVEEGLSALRYRLGVSFVPLAMDGFLLRIYGYGDGIEFEGRADSDIDLEFGVQTLIANILTVELGVSVRLLDAGHLDDAVEEQLELQGILDRHFDDGGTWGLYLGAGVLLTF